MYWNVSFEKRLPKAAGDTYENNLKITMNLNSFAPKKRMSLHERNEEAYCFAQPISILKKAAA
jgi:hypothetical protein